MSYAEKELIKKLAKNPNIKTAEDAQNAIKSLFGGLIQQMLEAEMEEYLGYSIIGMYTKGMSTRDIATQVN